LSEWVELKNSGLFFVFDLLVVDKVECSRCCSSLSTETVERLALALERIDHVHGSHGLAAGMFGVGDTVADHILQEDLEDPTGFFVDQSRDALDTTAASESANGWLGDSLDVVPENLALSLGASLSESFSSFAATRHDCSLLLLLVMKDAAAFGL